MSRLYLVSLSRKSVSYATLVGHPYLASSSHLPNDPDTYSVTLGYPYPLRNPFSRSATKVGVEARAEKQWARSKSCRSRVKKVITSGCQQARGEQERNGEGKKGTREDTTSSIGAVGGQERLRALEFGRTPDSVFCSDPPHPRAARVLLLLLFSNVVEEQRGREHERQTDRQTGQAHRVRPGGTRIAGIFVWGYNAHVTYGTLSASLSLPLSLRHWLGAQLGR